MSAGAKDLITIGDDLAELKDHFNAGRDKPRFLTVLSPT